VIGAKVVADSVSYGGRRITTLELTYPRFIHSEFMTHRAFSRNAASSRAIPVRKTIDQVLHNPAMPISFGAEKPGMQAGEQLDSDAYAYCWDAIMALRLEAIKTVEGLVARGLHKSVANRYLEPWQEMKTIVTATEWNNFFSLRIDKDAQAEIQLLAKSMFAVMSSSVPRPLSAGQWHVPYVTEEGLDSLVQRKLSVARCARVSYKNHDGTQADLERDLMLHDRLASSRHWSPFEHQATPTSSPTIWSGNFQGWQQHRKSFRSENREVYP
jgi:thymidylate synthase ThyX